MEKEKKDIRKNIWILENSIDYQKNSIVSRTIIDKKSGTITIFSFDKGLGLSAHTPPYDAFVYILQMNHIL